MFEYSSNNELIEIDERVCSYTPYNIMPMDLFLIVIKDGVIELNKI
jgi:hypothetical protein